MRRIFAVPAALALFLSDGTALPYSLTGYANDEKYCIQLSGPQASLFPIRSKGEPC